MVPVLFTVWILTGIGKPNFYVLDIILPCVKVIVSRIEFVYGKVMLKKEVICYIGLLFFH